MLTGKILQFIRFHSLYTSILFISEAEKHPLVQIYFQHKLKYCNLAKKELVFERYLFLLDYCI